MGTIDSSILVLNNVESVIKENNAYDIQKH